MGHVFSNVRQLLPPSVSAVHVFYVSSVSDGITGRLEVKGTAMCEWGDAEGLKGMWGGGGERVWRIWGGVVRSLQGVGHALKQRGIQGI